MKVLYAGPTWRGSNAQSWRRAFERLGHDVRAVDPERMLAFYGKSLVLRLVRKAIRGPLRRHVRTVERALVIAAREQRPDLVFVCKGTWMGADALDTIRRETGAALLHWHPDDYRNPDNTSPAFRESIPVYDLCVTPKSFNVAEFRSDGARRVMYVPYAYDPEVHHPVEPRPGPTPQAAFVGGFEPERSRSMERLVAAGVDLEVWGEGWERLARRSPLRPSCRFRAVFAEEMARVFCTARLSLGFLRKVNRDLHTARTFEIPASGGVMLTERTAGQTEHFLEDREALYFGCDEELVDKARFWARLPGELGRIRGAALDRCERSRYRYQDRLADLLDAWRRH